MYLGLLFYYTRNFVNTQKRLSEQGEKAVYNSMLNKIQDDYYNHDKLLTLFQTYVASILNYGYGIWGYHKAPDIDRVHMYFLKRILKVKKSTFFLLCTDNCILKNCYDEMFSSFNKKKK